MIKLESVYKSGKKGINLLYFFLHQRTMEGETNISHRGIPTLRQHAAFVRSRPYRFWYFILMQDRPVGSIYLTRQNEIGIYVSQQDRRQGFGEAAILQLITKHRPLPEIPGRRNGRFLANINPYNEASIRLFESLGFLHIQNTYALGKEP